MVGENGIIPSVDEMRIPLRYLANLLTAGKVEPMVKARTGAHDCHAPLQTRPGGARRNDWKQRCTAPASPRSHGGRHVPHHGHCQLRRPLCHPHFAQRMVENSFDDKSSAAASPLATAAPAAASEESLFGKRKGTPIVFHDRRRDIEENRDKGAR
jgi:nitrate reductase beta subunit